MPHLQTPMKARDFLALIAVVAIWGFNFVPSEIALRGFTPFQLGAARFLLFSIPLALFISRPPIPVKWIFIYGVTQGVGQFSLLYFSLQVGLTASLASVIMQCQVFFTALIAAAVLKEKIGAASLISMLIAVVGLGCFGVSVLEPSRSSEDITLAGLLLCLAASALWSCSNIVIRQVQLTGVNYSSFSLLVWGGLVSGVGFAVLSALFDDPNSHWQWLDASLLSWLSVLYQVVFSTAVAYGLWVLLLSKYQASQVAPYTLAVPIVGLVSGIVLLQESVKTLQWIGTGCLLVALIFNVFNTSLRTLINKMKTVAAD